MADPKRKKNIVNPPSLKQNDDLWLLLQRTNEAILKAREKETSQQGVSAMQTAVLFIIQTLGHRATPAEISRWLFRERHSVSELLSRMEKEGLVRRVRDLDRKNMVRVAITQKGKEAYYRLTEAESLRQIMSSLSEEEKQQLRLCLETLRERALQVMSGFIQKLRVDVNTGSGN